MKNKIRQHALKWMYNHSQLVYVKLFKSRKKAWNVHQHELLLFPEGTLGKELGLFYQKHQIKMMPKLENHDVYHVLSDTEVEAQDEIAMQYFLFGNGKISLYLLGVLCIGTLLYPEYWRCYLSHFKKGRANRSFYHWQFEHFLWENTIQLKQFIQKKSKTIQIPQI